MWNKYRRNLQNRNSTKQYFERHQHDVFQARDNNYEFARSFAIAKLGILHRFQDMYGTSDVQELSALIKLQTDVSFGNDSQKALDEVKERIHELAEEDLRNQKH